MNPNTPYPQELYRGWDAPSAQADFNATGGRNKAGYNGQDSQGGQDFQSSGTHFTPQAPADHSSSSGAISSPGFVDGTPDWIKPMIQKASALHNIPTALLSALLKQESGFNRNAVSPVGARGIAQFMPDTARGMGIDPNDPEQAITGAAKYLRTSWDKFGKPELALAAYNAGGGAVHQYGGIPPYKETQNYVKNIMAMAGEPHATAYGTQQDQLEAMQQRSQKNSGI